MLNVVKNDVKSSNMVQFFIIKLQDFLWKNPLGFV
jgi:hypothetical protein